MARVNIEEDFFSDDRVPKLARLMGWADDSRVYKTLINLWHGSQGRFKECGSAEDIKDWVRAANQEEGDRLVIALAQSEWIEKIGDDAFYISGNRKQVSNLKSASKKGRKGGHATFLKYKKEKNKRLRDVTPMAPGLPQASLGKGPAPASDQPEPGSIQCNSMQCNSVNTEAQSSDCALARSPSDSDFDQCYKAYPLKRDRGRALKRFREKIVQPDQVPRLLEAIQKLVEEDRPKEKNPYFKNFLEDWEEWLVAGSESKASKIVYVNSNGLKLQISQSEYDRWVTDARVGRQLPPPPLWNDS